MITPLFKKLNYKDQKSVGIVNSPKEFQKECTAINKHTIVETELSEMKDIEFVLIFVQSKKEVENTVVILKEQLIGDAIVWFAYPKGTSKKYTATIHRDNGWESIGQLEMEPVRGVAIDEDWSALRFRKVEYIKTLKRNPKMVISSEGKARAKS